MPTSVMVVAGEPGLLQLLGGGKRPTVGSVLERVCKLGQLVGLRSISVVGSGGSGLLQLTG